eukprot:14163183-Alexandrium_andersonii.AAC.1
MACRTPTARPHSQRSLERCTQTATQGCRSQTRRAHALSWDLNCAWPLRVNTVSYTHLTLPTICSV